MEIQNIAPSAPASRSPISKGWIISGIIVLVILVIGGWLWSTYNTLVVANENITTQWAQVEAQYQRRIDLIPNLVESVKGIMQQEQTVFTALADARANYSGAQTVDQKATAAGQVDSALSRLIAVVENYPQLKSADNVTALMAELAGTENRISVERMRYNDDVNSYNITVKRFPGSLIANMFGFTQHDYFTAVAGSDVAPTVKF